MDRIIEDNPANESLISDVFDREFGLADLLPIKDLEEILAPLSDLFYIEILNLNGGSYFVLQKIQIQKINQSIQPFLDKNASKILPGGHWDGHKVLFILHHEREPIGYLLVALLENQTYSLPHFQKLGNMLVVMLSRIIRLNCKVQMTSGLQCQVVEDSYAQLQIKAEQLAQSEQKYRLLAESLEKEVEEKTQTIQKALSTLAQQEKMASVGQLAAGVAHEINNPMGFIISNLNSLKEYGRDLRLFFETFNKLVFDKDKNRFAENRHTLRALYHQLDIDYILSDLDLITNESIEGAERIKKIVMDLKEYSKPGLHDAVIVDVNQLLQSVLNVCRTHIGERIHIEFKCEPLPQILCHPQEINQAIANIILNAIQAMDGEGRMHITTHALDNQVEVSIADTGCGIAKEDLTKIFDPFFTTKEVGSGTGLGLNFTYNVIQKHHGKICVESEVDKGSKFTIYLPFTQS